MEPIRAERAKFDTGLYTLTGGFHLVRTPEEEVRRDAGVLHDELERERVAPGHCTSALGFAVFLERFGERFDRAEVGAVLALPWAREGAQVGGPYPDRTLARPPCAALSLVFEMA